MNFAQLFYWKVWALSIFYSLVQFNQACKENLYSLIPDDFVQGWTILNRMKDNSDLEWNIMTNSFKKYWMLLAFQIICSQIISRTFTSVLPLFYSCYSILCLTIIVGVPGIISYLAYILIMFLAHKSGKKSICYVLTLCTLPLLYNSRFLQLKDKLILDETQSFLYDVGLAWLLAKCLSFSLDCITSGANRRNIFKEIPCVLSYCLYLPVFFTGPILSYEMFYNELYLKPLSSNFYRGLRRLFYIMCWYFVYELLLHFIYSSAIQFYPDTVSTFEGWAFCGLGYALPMMFYLKYFVIYGVAGQIANLEGFNFPPPPKCISSIHLSSFLWRHFDRGLYLWIRKYLYYPILNSKWTILRKLIALFICFAFVCLWHGMDKAVTAWCTINFFLVSSENVLQRLLIRKQKTSRFHVRITALLSTPHFLMMCLSCTFFLSNWDIGVLFMKRILLSGVKPILPLACIMYCGCHVSLLSKKYQVNTYTF